MPLDGFKSYLFCSVSMYTQVGSVYVLILLNVGIANEISQLFCGEPLELRGSQNEESSYVKAQPRENHLW